MDKYERIKVIGRGAFGLVFLCNRLKDNRKVIIKQIPVEQLSKIDRQSTINEIKVLAMLHHPNIIEYYESFIQEQAMMIVMEYASGGTLYDYLESVEGFLDEFEIANLFAQMVLPLKMVHSRQILHRDLKTQNIFLTRGRNQIKIGDFGISKILSSKSKAYTVVGTPSYISPELCEGKPYNQKSDIWALGCVLYEMCTLKRAFEAPTLPALVLKIMRGNYLPLPVHYSPMLKDLVDSLLSLDPNGRPNLSQIMSHPWLAPHLHRLPFTLGLLPCTAKPPRPFSSMTKFTDVFNMSNSIFTHTKGRISPFLKDSENSSSIFILDLNEKKDTMRPFECSTHKLTCLCSVDKGCIMGATNEGKVIVMKENKSPTFIESLSGISIIQVSVGQTIDGKNFFFLITDRGILLTFGNGSSGCLGHGDNKSIQKPKIVEALLGDEVMHVAHSSNHVCIMTTDNEIFTWGTDLTSSGCLGHGSLTQIYVPRKVILDEEIVIDSITVGDGATILKTKQGQILIAGKSLGNRFGNSIESSGNEFVLIKDMDSKIDEIRLISQENYCLIITDERRKAFIHGPDSKVKVKLDDQISNEVIAKISTHSLSEKFIISTTNGNIYVGDLAEISSNLSYTMKKLSYPKIWNDFHNEKRLSAISQSNDGFIVVFWDRIF